MPTMLSINESTLSISRPGGAAAVELPRLQADSIVRVWAVPTEYRANGVFVSTTPPNQPEEIPACDPADAHLLGELDYPASQELLRQAAFAAAHARIEAWRDQQEATPIVFEHAGRQWDGGLVTRQRLQPVVALAALPDGFFWTDHANNDVPVSLDELKALNAAHEAALVVCGFEIHATQRAMKAELGNMELSRLRDFDL